VRGSRTENRRSNATQHSAGLSWVVTASPPADSSEAQLRTSVVLAPFV